MFRKLILLATIFLLLAFGSFGCGPSTIAGPDSKQLAEQRIKYRKYQILYTECGTWVLDYPADFVGPIPNGHGRVGSTSTDLCPEDIIYTGDPTADD